MQVIAGMTGQPGFNLGMFVGGVVVHHQVHIDVGQDVAVQVLEKGQEFLMTMAGFALRDHAAIQDVEGGKERSGAVAEVVVSDPLDVLTQTQRQDRLGAFERLNLAFFVHAQDQGVVGDCR